MISFKINREKCLKMILTTFLIYYVIYEITSRYGPFSVTGINLVLLCVLGIEVLLCLIVNRSSWCISMESMCWIPFLTVLFYQVVRFNCAKTYFLLFVLLFLIILGKNNVSWDMDRIVKTIRWISTFYAIGVLLQLLLPSVQRFFFSMFHSAQGIQTNQYFSGRGYYPGFSYQPGNTAFYLIAGIFVEMFCDNNNKKRRILLIILYVIGLFFQGKRSILIFGLMVCILTLIMNAERSKKVQRWLKVILFIGIAFMIISSVVQFYSDNILVKKMLSSFSIYEAEGFNGVIGESGRSKLYELAITLIAESPLFGIGWHGFSAIEGSIYSTTTSVHNCYLQLYCETGILGLISFLLGAIFMLFQLFKSRKLLFKIKNEIKNDLIGLWSFSFSGQIFFLLYCLVENPLYNENCLIYYMLSIISNFVLMCRIRKYSASTSVNDLARSL